MMLKNGLTENRIMLYKFVLEFDPDPQEVLLEDCLQLVVELQYSLLPSLLT